MAKRSAQYGISSKDFYRRAGCTSQQMRLAEALKIIQPIRTPYGRLFSEADVKAMRAWEGNIRCPARGKRSRATAVAEQGGAAAMVAA